MSHRQMGTGLSYYGDIHQSSRAYHERSHVLVDLRTLEFAYPDQCGLCLLR